MIILIFGNSGLVGKQLELHFKKLGHSTIGVSRNGKSDYNFDISDFNNFKQIKEKPDVIVNCASILPNNQFTFEDEYLRKLFQINVFGAVNIVKWAKNNSIKKIINFSTLSINNKPWKVPLDETITNLVSGKHTAYAMSKLCQEKLMTEFDLDCELNIIHLRLSAVYGTNMKKEGIIFYIQKFIDKNENVIITDGNKVSFDFINTNDINSIIEQILSVNIPSGSYNLASGEEVRLLELAKTIAKINNNYKGKILNSESDKDLSRSLVSSNKLLSYLKKDFKFTPLENGLKTLLIS